MKSTKLLSVSLFLLSLFQPLKAQESLTNSSANTLWEFATSGKVLSSPIIHNNILYIGSDDKNFYAIDIENGTEIWSYSTNDPVRSTPSIDNNIICFESGNILYALNLNGELIWEYDLCESTYRLQYDGWDYFHSSPAISNGIVYICTEQGQAYGIDLATGTEVFKCSTGENHGIRTSPAVYDGKIYFGDWHGKLYCFDLTSAELVWLYDTYPERAWSGGASISTSPVVAEGKVYFAGRSSILFCLDAETGNKIWSFTSPTSQWIVGGPTYENGVIYMGSSDQRWFRAFNAETGEIIWEIKVDQNVFSTPKIAEEYIYFGTGNAYRNNTGSVYAVNKSDGEIRNTYSFNTAIHSSPIFFNNNLYFGGYNGNVYSIQDFGVTGIEQNNMDNDLNKSFQLNQNYPNPFNPRTIIIYNLPFRGHVDLEIFDLSGRKVKTLINGMEEAGKKEVIWGGKNNYNKNVSAGVYFYRLAADKFVGIKKMILLK